MRPVFNHIKEVGKLIVRGEHLHDYNEKWSIRCKGVGLEDVAGLFMMFRPFFSILRAMSNGAFQRVYTSEASRGINP